MNAAPAPCRPSRYLPTCESCVRGDLPAQHKDTSRGRWVHHLVIDPPAILRGTNCPLFIENGQVARFALQGKSPTGTTT